MVGDAIWNGLVSTYKASSTYKENGNDFEVKNLDNLFVDNCWAEGAKGKGIGETIEINAFGSSEKVGYMNKNKDSIDDMIEYLLKEYNKEDMKNYYSEVKQVAIINGYAKDDTLWKNNGRVKKLKLTIDDKEEYILELDDSKELQLFDINYKNGDITKKINLKFEILDVYSGEKYEDTCLTSLYLVGGSNVNWGGR